MGVWVWGGGGAFDCFFSSPFFFAPRVNAYVAMPSMILQAARRRHRGPPPQQPAPVVEWGPLHLPEAFVSFVCRGTSVTSATRLRASPVLRAPGQVVGLETLAPRHAPRAQVSLWRLASP